MGVLSQTFYHTEIEQVYFGQPLYLVEEVLNEVFPSAITSQVKGTHSGVFSSANGTGVF